MIINKYEDAISNLAAKIITWFISFHFPTSSNYLSTALRFFFNLCTNTIVVVFLTFNNNIYNSSVYLIYIESLDMPVETE